MYKTRAKSLQSLQETRQPLPDRYRTAGRSNSKLLIWTERYLGTISSWLYRFFELQNLYHSHPSHPTPSFNS